MKTTPQEFIYWLQGFFEIVNPTTLNEEQTAKIQAKLESCFNKVTVPIPVVPMDLGNIYPWQNDMVFKTDIVEPAYITRVSPLEDFKHLFESKTLPPDWRDTKSYITG